MGARAVGLRIATTVLVALSAVSLAPSTASASTAAAGDAVLDLRSDCANHKAEAGRVQGWARSRYEQCHFYDNQRIKLRTAQHQYLGSFEFDLWVLAFAYDGQRRVDYRASVEDVRQGSTLRDDLTYLTIKFDCQGNNVVCSPTRSRADTIAGWYAKPGMDVVTVTSPNDSGDGPHKIVKFTETVSFVAEYRNGRTHPFHKDVAATNRVRFDSAAQALGSGKHTGTVFTDHMPRFTLRLTGDGSDQESRHVDDALNHTERTFPSTIGKNVPGRSPKDPLERLMDPAKRRANNEAAKKICQDVWGDNYAAGGLQCDEYPFASTYQGAAESTGNQPFSWHGSARPITGADNVTGGSLLGAFYGANRVLDKDRFYVVVNP